MLQGAQTVNRNRNPGSPPPALPTHVGGGSCRVPELTVPPGTSQGRAVGCRTPLTFMLTSSLKAAFCNSKARLESAILVSARNLTSIISFLHSASCGEETASGAPGCAARAEEAVLGKPSPSLDSPECQHLARLLPPRCPHPVGRPRFESFPGSSGNPLCHRHPGEGKGSHCHRKRATLPCSLPTEAQSGCSKEPCQPAAKHTRPGRAGQALQRLPSAPQRLGYR